MGGIGVEGCLCGALLGPEGSREFVSSGASVPRLRLLGGVASFVPSSGRLVGGGGLVGVLFENWTVDASILLIVLGSLR